MQDEVSFPGRSWRSEFLTSIEGIVAGSGNDTLIGDGGANYLAGSDGNDSLVGGGGDDTLDGGFGKDTIQGGNGSDTVQYSSVWQDLRIRIGAQLTEFYNHNGVAVARDRLTSIEHATGGSGNDTLLGTNAVNRLDGGDGDDKLRGRENDDVLVLSSGHDTLDGGSGTDTLLVDLRQEIADHAHYSYLRVDSGYGDRIESSYDAGVFVDLFDGAARGSAGYVGRSTLNKIENVEILDAWGADTVLGSDADNVIHVGWGANYVRGTEETTSSSAAPPRSRSMSPIR